MTFGSTRSVRTSLEATRAGPLPSRARRSRRRRRLRLSASTGSSASSWKSRSARFASPSAFASGRTRRWPGDLEVRPVLVGIPGGSRPQDGNDNDSDKDDGEEEHAHVDRDDNRERRVRVLDAPPDSKCPSAHEVHMPPLADASNERCRHIQPERTESAWLLCGSEWLRRTPIDKEACRTPCAR